MSKIAREIGRKIRQLRKDKGWTQEYLAGKCSLDYRSIGAAERGERNLSLESLVKVARALNVSIDYLMSISQPRKGDKTRDRIIKEMNNLFGECEFKKLLLISKICQLIVENSDD